MTNLGILSSAEKADRINGFVSSDGPLPDEIRDVAHSKAAEEFYAGFEETQFGLRYRHIAGFAIHASALSKMELAKHGISSDQLRDLVNFFVMEEMIPPNGEIVGDVTPPSAELIAELKASRAPLVGVLNIARTNL